MKSLDKKKTKELECKHIWKINNSDFGLICEKCKACKMGKGKRIFWRVYKNPIQQRTELLEEILNLECLKEEKDREQRGSSIDYNFDVEIKNQLRKEIKEEIKKL